MVKDPKTYSFSTLKILATVKQIQQLKAQGYKF